MKQAWTLLEMLVAMTLLSFFIGLWSQVVHQAILKNQSRAEMEWVIQSMDLWTNQIISKGYHAYQHGDHQEETKTSPSGKQFILHYETKFYTTSKSKQIIFQVLTSSDRKEIAKWFGLLEIPQP